MTIGSTANAMPMPVASSNLENKEVPVSPVQTTSSRDNEATEVSSADDAKSSSSGIDIYA